MALRNRFRSFLGLDVSIVFAGLTSWLWYFLWTKNIPNVDISPVSADCLQWPLGLLLFLVHSVLRKTLLKEAPQRTFQKLSIRFVWSLSTSMPLRKLCYGTQYSYKVNDVRIHKLPIIIVNIHFDKHHYLCCWLIFSSWFSCMIYPWCLSLDPERIFSV